MFQPRSRFRYVTWPNPRGALIGERSGSLKLLFSWPDAKLLGVHVIGDNACELIAAGRVARMLGATYPSTSYNEDAMGRVLRGDVYRP